MKTVNINFVLLVSACLLILFAIKTFFVKKDSQVKFPMVLISQVVDHPALNSTIKGIIDGLKAAGFIEQKNLTIKIESAQASQALASQIASKFIGMKPQVVVGVGTLSAQSFTRFLPSNNSKLVFSSVTDPVGAHLVTELSQPCTTTTGVSNFVNLEPQLELFKKILPTMKKLGIIYNAGEPNSVSIVNKLTELTPSSGITLVKKTINKSNDINQIAAYLVEQVDAIFISNDNTVLSAMKTLVNIATQQKIPVFVSDTDAVKLGALAALGPNQYSIGIQTGAMIAKILAGTPMSKIKVQFPEKTELFLNNATAQKLGINFPEELIKQAKKIVNN